MVTITRALISVAAVQLTGVNPARKVRDNVMRIDPVVCARRWGIHMNISAQSLRIGIAATIVLGAIGFLAFTSAEADKSYFVTVAEMQGMGDKAYSSHLRVDGFVKPDSIQQSGPNVTFVLTEFESHNPKANGNPHSVRVSYLGSEPPPDTFKGDAQALAIGTFGRDGVFHATQLQAKCASKYAPAQPGSAQPGPVKPAVAAQADKRT
jgi:cytochrome c-type biogenesis protein CcmE